MLCAEQLKILGERLVELRRQKGVTAVEVARDVLGYENGSHVAVTRLERGVLTRPRVDHLQALAKFYEAEPAHLFIPELQSGSGALAPKPAPVSKKQARGHAPSTLPGRIQWVRESAGLDPEAFALAVRHHGAIITSGNVAAWETGEQSPNPVQLRALSLFSHRSENWFLHGDDRPVTGPATGGLSWTLASRAGQHAVP